MQLDGGSRAAAKIPAVRHGNMVWYERGSRTVNEPAAAGGLLPDQLLRLLSSALTPVAQTAMRFDRALAIAAPARRAYGGRLGSHAACSVGVLRGAAGPWPGRQRAPGGPPPDKNPTEPDKTTTKRRQNVLSGVCRAASRGRATGPRGPQRPASTRRHMTATCCPNRLARSHIVADVGAT